MLTERDEFWDNHFPKTEKELDVWQPYTNLYALASRVLAVARSRQEGAWSAYCDQVPGINHHSEIGLVLLHGDKLSERVARCLFPEFEGVPYAL